MALKFLKYGWKKIAAVCSLGFILFILIAAIFVNNYWSPILAGKVKDAVADSTDGLYTVSFADAELHVLRGSIVIYNIVLKPDTSVYALKKQQHLAPNNLVELRIKRLTLSNIHPLSLYFRHKLIIGEILLNRPELSITYQLNHTKDTVVKDNRTAWQKISKSLRSVYVKSIILNDVKFRYEDYSGNKVAISELKELNVNARELLIDSVTQTDRSRLLYCKDVVAQLSNFKGKSANGLYSYSVNSVTLSTLKSRLNIQGLVLKPVSPAVFFDKTLRSRFTLKLDSVQLNNFDYLNYHKYRSVAASSFVVNSGSFQVFGNPRQSPKETNGVTSFPNAAFEQIKADINIDTILLNRLNVAYTEYNTTSKKTGSISFNNTSGRLLNLTTNNAALQKKHIANLQLTSYFMNRGKFNVEFNFDLTDKNNAFNYNGTLGPMDLQQINQATMPLAMIKITSGKLKQFNFNVRADKSSGHGKVTVLYNDLKVKLLKADTVQDKLKRSTIASMYANLFILKHNNPDIAGADPRSFNVVYARQFKTPFFQFVWQTLLSGIKPAVGLDTKTQEASKAMMKKSVIKKQERKLKRAQRKLRRAERRKKAKLEAE